ncbi:hypothetical protein HPB51_023693 [Rhipicephalus microplus]|uniref:ABC1 atypical kinase-like domain-containing protein n=1 Tax=Rhipicephalus microplus TaxID=6941 RepID=A0A9J6E550_RHIMP|nr:hypothetical protein HPB51_023693 [Rhipicephalus microplus]
MFSCLVFWQLLVNIVAKIFPEFSLMWLAEETKRNLPLELDFINEAHNTERVRRMFSHFPWLEVSSRLGQLYSEMIFVQGYVHCDPHPGNLLVRQGSQGPTLVLLDHGLYTYANLWLALIRRDLESLQYWGNQLGVSGELYKILSCIVSGRSWTSITRGIDRQKHTKAEVTGAMIIVL